MFQDGIKTREAEETVKVMDIAEILAASAVWHPANSGKVKRISGFEPASPVELPKHRKLKIGD